MSFELDHILICAPYGAPVADRLVDAGFTEGTRNRHPGQGTANRRFFFDNAFIEFIWVEEEDEIRSDLVAPTRLWERMNWRETGASPFEFCIRPARSDAGAIPFSTFSYRPPYLPPGDEIPMADQIPVEEPGSFVNLTSRAPARAPGNAQPLDHRNGVRRVHSINVTCPGDSETDVSTALETLGIASYSRGEGHAIEIEFDGASETGELCLEPDLPVLLRW